MRTLLCLTLAAACSTTTPPPKTETYPEVPADPQRPGDPAKGYEYLINGGYITCGLPKTLWDQYIGASPAEDRLPGRTGDNATLAYNYSVATSAEGVKVVTANCLACHAGKINGQLVVGLGASDADFTGDQSKMIDAVGGLINDATEKQEWQRFDDRMKAIADYSKTLTIGVNPADSLTGALFSHRDPVTLAWSPTPMIDLPPITVPPVHVPPWWRMSKKTAMFYSTAGRGDHARIEMTAALLCTESVDEAREIDAAFVDVRAWIETLKPPAYPFAIDMALAEQGKHVFAENCTRCHGTYGDNGIYPNELVPLDVVGTDSLLARGTIQLSEPYLDWFKKSFWGEMSRLDPQDGYIAPPLDGIWASAPYFHNGSVPTLASVLDSSSRPKYWVRTFDSMDYDQTAVGWKFTVMNHGQDQELAQKARVQIYDTTKPGYGNAGHTFGDVLSADDRKAVIEYLKTL